MPVPLFDTDTPLAPLREQIIARVAEVIRGGRFILGPELRAFEQELAAYVGVPHAIGVGNGTDAISIAARALDIGPGDEVVLPSFTFYATAEAIATIGATPIFCDVDFDTRNVTVETVRAAITPKTKAILAVDLFGLPAPIPDLRREFGLPVIEDAAQALGASLGVPEAADVAAVGGPPQRYGVPEAADVAAVGGPPQRYVRAGALGDIATISFYPSKNLGAFGDGGAVTTGDPELAERVAALRFHGSRDKQTFEYVGYNSRLDEIQAAVLRMLLPHLDAWCDGRRAGAAAYVEAGLGDHVRLAATPSGAVAAWHLYVVTAENPERRLMALNAAGVQARAYYRVPLHRQPALAAFAAAQGADLPVTDALAAANLALPISPVFTRAQAAEVVAALAAA